MQNPEERVDVTRVAAAVYVLQAPAGTSRRRQPAAPPPPPKRLRVTLSWREPTTWTGILLVVLAVVVAAQHPIARAIGTAGGTAPRVVAAAPPPAAQRPVAARPPLSPRPSVPVARHAPLDPFRALVAADGSLREPQTITMPGSGRWKAGPTPKQIAAKRASRRAAATRGPGGGSCPAVHVVRAGESLWSIAQTHVKATGHASWQQIYQLNRSVIGANPDQLTVGTHLCLPTSGRSP